MRLRTPLPRMSGRALGVFGAIVLASLIFHGLLFWGLILADEPPGAPPVQEIAVELVTGIPGEKDGKPAPPTGERSKPATKEQPEQARDAQKPPAEPTDTRKQATSPDQRREKAPAQQQTARTDPQRATAPTGSPQSKSKDPPKQSPPVHLPFFLFPDQSGIGPAAARAPGRDEKNADWRASVLGMLVTKKDRLEEMARSRGANGSVAIAFSVGDGGEVEGMELLRSSGQPELDAEALTMVREASPFPRPPAGAIRKFAPIIAFGG